MRPLKPPIGVMMKIHACPLRGHTKLIQVISMVFIGSQLAEQEQDEKHD